MPANSSPIIKFYVPRVLATVEPDDQASAVLAARLLRPRNAWKSRPAKTAEAPQPPPAPAPAQAPA